MDGILKLVVLSMVAAVAVPVVAPSLMQRFTQQSPTQPSAQTATLAPPPPPPPPPPAPSNVTNASLSPAWREVRLEADASGHFTAAIDVRGTRIDALVDTGASGVALTAEDAKKIGINVSERDFTVTVGTANGRTAVAPVRLDVIRIGSIAVYDVPAHVMKPGASGISLLGMTFLNKLKSFEVANGKLVLRQ